MAEPGPLEILNGFVLHTYGQQITMSCSWRQPVPPGARKPPKCRWRTSWDTKTIGIPIRLAMDEAVEHMAKEHGQ